MVNYDVPECLHGFWDKESEDTPLFEEILRFAAMFEISGEFTTITCVEAQFVIDGVISFKRSKRATAYAKLGWNLQVAWLLYDAYQADWLDKKLIVVLTK